MEERDAPIVDLSKDAEADAKALSFEQRFLAGAELFDYAFELSLAGVRMRSRTCSDAEARTEVARRMAIAKRMREHP